MPDRPVLDPVEQRVLGALLEKQRTVPDTYPLSLNALRAACNQATSRDPVVAYDETTLVDGLGRLRDRELVRFVKPTGLRVVKYHQRLEEHLALDPEQAALIAVLLLRGRPDRRASCGRAPNACTRSPTARLSRAALRAWRPLTRRWSASWNGNPDSTTGAGSICWAPTSPRRPSPPRRSTSSRCWRTAPAPAIARSRPSTTGWPSRTPTALGDELDGKPFDRWLLARLAAEAAGGQGLDVGCGPGHVAGYLAEHGVVMTGLDLSPNMVAQARARQPDVHVRPGQLRGAADAPGR